jgi:hypothetical protein
MVFSLARSGPQKGRLEKKEGNDGSRPNLSSGFTNDALFTRARLHAACRSGGVATGRERTSSSGADISSDRHDVKV